MHDPSDAVTACRAGLPRRLNGCGIRPQTRTAAAAYVGGLLQCLPNLINRKLADGSTIPGLDHQCAKQLIEAGSLDAGGPPGRWASFLASPSPIAAELRSAWETLQAIPVAVPVDPDRPDSPLLLRPAAEAGATAGGGLHPQPQHALTSECENAIAYRLDQHIRALDRTDRRRVAWMNVDHFSRQFIASCPSGGAGFIDNAELAECYAEYLGLPSPSCYRHRERPVIPGDSRKIGPYGEGLVSASLGGGWRVRHDDVKWTLADLLSWADIPHEVEPRGLFSHLIAAGPAAQGSPTERARQGIIPDLIIDPPGDQRFLADIKALDCSSASRNRYLAADPARRCRAVGNRQTQVHSDYHSSARRLDGTPGACGPVEQALRGYGRVRGLICGSFGEASDDLHALATLIAETAAHRHWRGMGCTDQAGALSHCYTYVRRTLGIAICRSHARLKLSRLGNAFGDAAGAASRRAAWPNHWRHLRATVFRARGPSSYAA